MIVLGKKGQKILGKLFFNSKLRNICTMDLSLHVISHKRKRVQRFLFRKNSLLT